MGIVWLSLPLLTTESVCVGGYYLYWQSMFLCGHLIHLCNLWRLYTRRQHELAEWQNIVHVSPVEAINSNDWVLRYDKPHDH